MNRSISLETFKKWNKIKKNKKGQKRNISWNSCTNNNKSKLMNWPTVDQKQKEMHMRTKTTPASYNRSEISSRTRLQINFWSASNPRPKSRFSILMDMIIVLISHKVPMKILILRRINSAISPFRMKKTIQGRIGTNILEDISAILVVEGTSRIICPKWSRKSWRKYGGKRNHVKLNSNK